MKALDILQARLSNQWLARTRSARPTDVVVWLGAVQAQDFRAAKWSVGQRTAQATDSDVERAFNDGAILRTHVMRPTWHFIAPRDIRSILALTAPRILAGNARMHHRLELDAGLLARCHRVVAGALRGHTYLTRSELAGRLRMDGIDATGQRLAYILMHAELDALICSGPRRGKQFTYALLEERAPRAQVLARDDALSDWTLRYFAGHGPAQAQDFAWWSGLTMGDARRGLELAAARLTHETFDGKTYWFSPQTRAARTKVPQALLLSIYDEYTIAYRDRSLLAEDRYLEKLLSMGNALTSVLVVDGGIAGTWKRTVRPGRLAITLDPFRPLRRDERDAVAAAAARYEAFLGGPEVVVTSGQDALTVRDKWKR